MEIDDDSEESQTTACSTSTNDQDLAEIIQNLKSKFSTLKASDHLKLGLLTVLPKNWSSRKIATTFETSRYLAQKSKEHREKYGILPESCARIGRTLSDNVIAEVKNFYNSDEVSRPMPGKKEVVSMTVDGQSIKVQKRLLLLDLKALYALFKASHDHNISKVGFSTFCKLRPKNCILMGKKGTHSVCVCTKHENVKMMIQAVNWKTISKNSKYVLNDYKDFMAVTMCKNAKPHCYFGLCDKCPAISELSDYVLKILGDANISRIEYGFWTSTDRATLKTVTSSDSEYVNELMDQLEILKAHSFIAKKQAEFIKKKIENLGDGEVVVKFDFAENFAYVVQNASQAFHFNNNQSTVFTIIFYYKKDGELKSENCVFISDSLKHNTSAVYTIQQQLIPYIKEKVRKVQKLVYITDGAKQHFKNKFQVSNLMHHKKDFNIQAEWHFTATAHGKCACDGLGATFKREAYRASLLAKPTESILDQKSLYAWAKEFFTGITIFKFNSTEHNRLTRKLNARFKKAKPVTGISTHHAFIVCSSKLHMKKYSDDSNEVIIDMKGSIA